MTEEADDMQKSSVGDEDVYTEKAIRVPKGSVGDEKNVAVKVPESSVCEEDLIGGGPDEKKMQPLKSFGPIL